MMDPREPHPAGRSAPEDTEDARSAPGTPGADTGRQDAAEDATLLRAFGVMYRTFIAWFTDFLAGTGVSYSEGVLLVNIAVQPGTGQEALVRDLGIDKAAVARGVKGLREKGLVESGKSPSDGRLSVLTCLPAGQALANSIAAANRTWVAAVMEGLPPDQHQPVFRAVALMADRARCLSCRGEGIPPSLREYAAGAFSPGQYGAGAG